MLIGAKLKREATELQERKKDMKRERRFKIALISEEKDQGVRNLRVFGFSRRKRNNSGRENIHEGYTIQP